MKRTVALGESIRRLGGEEGFGLVEALVAAIILAVGLMAVAGLSMSTAGHGRVSEWQTHQAMAGRLALASAHQAGFDSVSSRTASYEVGGHVFEVKIAVTRLTARVKEVEAEVSGVGRVRARTFTTRLYAARQLPVPLGG